MNVKIQIPDAHIDQALKEANTRYWAASAVWDVTDRTGWVIERGTGDAPEGPRHIYGSWKIQEALVKLGNAGNPLFWSLLMGKTDPDDGDKLLQMVLFGEVRHV
jgi:hypothetical protein